MPIPEHIKAAVAAKILTDLHLYWQEAEELEDDNVLTNAADRVKDFYLYQHLASHRTPLGDIKTYVIHQDAYGHLPNHMHKVQCTWRRLLEIVNDIETSMYDDVTIVGPKYTDKTEFMLALRKRWYNAVEKRESGVHWLYMVDGITVGEWNCIDTEDHYGYVYKTYRELPNEELLDLFNTVNGDGQPYTTVFCLEDNKIVLGGHLA